MVVVGATEINRTGRKRRGGEVSINKINKKPGKVARGRINQSLGNGARGDKTTPFTPSPRVGPGGGADVKDAESDFSRA